MDKIKKIFKRYFSGGPRIFLPLLVIITVASGIAYFSKYMPVDVRLTAVMQYPPSQSDFRSMNIRWYRDGNVPEVENSVTFPNPGAENYVTLHTTLRSGKYRGDVTLTRIGNDEKIRHQITIDVPSSSADITVYLRPDDRK